MTNTHLGIERLDIGARMSEAAIHNGTVYLAGQVASATGADIKGQTREVLAQIDELLARANSDRSQILMAQIFLADMADFQAMNEVWDGWVVKGHTPCRATVQASLAKSEWKVEVVVTAATVKHAKETS
jgi:enamine deaminase RidA (YjgF/YER057c/UK114 family)